MPFQPIRSVTSQTQADEISLLLQSLGIEAQVFRAVSYEPSVRTLWIVLVETSQFTKAQQILAEEDALLSPVSSVQTSSIMRGAHSDFSNDLWWLFSLIPINIGIWWIMEQQGGSQQTTTLIQFGAITSPLLSAGEWWRLVTALFVHIGIRHLVANMAVLLALGALTLADLGARPILLCLCPVRDTRQSGRFCFWVWHGRQSRSVRRYFRTARSAGRHPAAAAQSAD